MVINDIIGDSGTAFKQASEGLDRVRAKASEMASFFLSSSSSSSIASQSGPGSISANEANTIDIVGAGVF